jgi:hypothetical protein
MGVVQAFLAMELRFGIAPAALAICAVPTPASVARNANWLSSYWTRFPYGCMPGALLVFLRRTPHFFPAGPS